MRQTTKLKFSCFPPKQFNARLSFRFVFVFFSDCILNETGSVGEEEQAGAASVA